MENTESVPIRWAVGLSNGESLVEGHGKVKRVAGELSPWHKLQKYMKENNLRIVSMSLVEGDRHYNLPQAKDYRCFKRGEVYSSNRPSKNKICAQAIYDDFVFEVWIDLNDTNKVWFKLIRSEDEHTQL